jgi:hypothetical protein
MTNALFSTLMADPQSEHWTESDLQKLSVAELQGLAKLFGAPTSGSKAELAERLLTYRKIRIRLSRYDDDAEALAQSHGRESLWSMCDAVNLWKSGSKVQLAAGLLNRRNRCRHEGQQFLAQLRAESKTRPVQLSLFGNTQPVRLKVDPGAEVTGLALVREARLEQQLPGGIPSSH